MNHHRLRLPIAALRAQCCSLAAKVGARFVGKARCFCRAREMSPRAEPIWKSREKRRRSSLHRAAHKGKRPHSSSSSSCQPRGGSGNRPAVDPSPRFAKGGFAMQDGLLRAARDFAAGPRAPGDKFSREHGRAKVPSARRRPARDSLLPRAERMMAPGRPYRRHYPAEGH